jgi:hypothetical protein
MERELDISYWTVRRRLDDLILELGLEAEPIEEIDSSAEQRAILEQLNQGEITATQAAELLSQLKRPGYPA